MIPRGRLSQNILVEGRPALTASRAAAWAAHCAFRRPAEVEIEAGGPVMRLRPRLRNYGSTALYMKRFEYEPELAFLAGLIQSGDVLLDVGANFGIYALVCAKRTGASGRVYAFEPGAEALHALRVNCALNPDLNVEVLPMGLSDSIRSSRLFHTGGPTTFNLSANGAATGEPVELTTLDAWIVGAGVPRVAVIKIDVEGHEPAVFAGGRNTLLSTRPLVMFEGKFGCACTWGIPEERFLGITCRAWL